MRASNPQRYQRGKNGRNAGETFRPKAGEIKFPRGGISPAPPVKTPGGDTPSGGIPRQPQDVFNSPRLNRNPAVRRKTVSLFFHPGQRYNYFVGLLPTASTQIVSASRAPLPAKAVGPVGEKRSGKKRRFGTTCLVQVSHAKF